jgi:hypothetical protein
VLRKGAFGVMNDPLPLEGILRDVDTCAETGAIIHVDRQLIVKTERRRNLNIVVPHALVKLEVDEIKASE